METKQYDPNGKNAFKLSFVTENLNDLLGKILTVIDASVVDERQNKSMKDLIKEKVNLKQEWFCECAWKDKPQGFEESNRIAVKPSLDWFNGIVEI
jgi:hypothetical protein